MTTSMTEQRSREWPFVRAGILATAVVLAFVVVGTEIEKRLHPGASALTTTAKCLRNEKGLTLAVGAVDPIGKSADRGVIRTRIEDSGVTIVILSSDKRAEKIAGFYAAVNPGAADAVARRGHVVYVWEGSPTPTQRQTVYDCYY